MADPVKEAKSTLHHARNDRQEKAGSWWQQAVIEGRVLRQARAEMQVGERQTQQQETTQSRPQMPRQSVS